MFSDTSDSQLFSRRVYAAENMCDKHCRKPFSYGNSHRQVFRCSNLERWTNSAGLGVQPQAAAASGCKQLFLGFESISQQSMAGVNKGFNQVEQYARIIERIHAHGIAVLAGIVFGFDHDTPAIFENTLDFLEETGVQNATFNILTPFPGTPLFHQMEAQGRILTRDWSKYNSRDDVVYHPLKMSVAELLAGFRYANARFYSALSIAKRLAHSSVQLWWVLPLNLGYAYRWRFPRKT